MQVGRAKTISNQPISPNSEEIKLELPPGTAGKSRVVLGTAVKSAVSTESNGGGIVSVYCNVELAKDSPVVMGFLDMNGITTRHPELFAAMALGGSNPAVADELTKFLLDETKRNDIILWAVACKSDGSGTKLEQASFVMPFVDPGANSEGVFQPFLFAQGESRGKMVVRQLGICSVTDDRCFREREFKP